RSRFCPRLSAIPSPGQRRSAPRYRTSPSRCVRTTWSACARKWSRSPAAACSRVSRAAGSVCAACPTCCTRTGWKGSRRAPAWWCGAPANGGFRPNPALGGPGVDLVQLGLERRSEGFAVRRDLHLETMLEGGRQDGGATYLRLSGAGHVLFPVGATRMLVRAQGGVASADLPAHRAFVLGGRGTLLGGEFRRRGRRWRA